MIAFPSDSMLFRIFIYNKVVMEQSNTDGKGTESSISLECCIAICPWQMLMMPVCKGKVVPVLN
jgi:hypothetical protein